MAHFKFRLNPVNARSFDNSLVPVPMHAKFVVRRLSFGSTREKALSKWLIAWG